MGFIKAAVALQLLLSSVSALPAALVGLEKKAVPFGSTIYDAVVVGGGPAGLSAGKYYTWIDHLSGELDRADLGICFQ